MKVNKVLKYGILVNAIPFCLPFDVLLLMTNAWNSCLSTCGFLLLVFVLCTIPGICTIPDFLFVCNCTCRDLNVTLVAILTLVCCYIFLNFLYIQAPIFVMQLWGHTYSPCEKQLLVIQLVNCFWDLINTLSPFCSLYKPYREERELIKWMTRGIYLHIHNEIARWVVWWSPSTFYSGRVHMAKKEKVLGWNRVTNNN